MAAKSKSLSMDDLNLRDTLIGELKGKLDTLITQVQVSEQSSQASRKRVHEELEAMRLDAAAIKSTIDDMDGRLKAAEPVVSEIKIWKERFIGMQILMAAVGTVVVSGAVYMYKWLTVKFGL